MSLKPEIGMGATVWYWSDRDAFTVIDISKTGKSLVLQRDKATRTDNNGMSDVQSYTYERDPDGEVVYVTYRKDHKFKVSKTNSIVLLGIREKFHDYSF